MFMSSLDKISSHPSKDTLQIRDSDHSLQLEYSIVHHCSFCCPSVTADTPPWPLFTSLIHAHSPSTDSFHSVTSKTEQEQFLALNISCFPFSWSYHSVGLVIAYSHMSRVCELSVPHKYQVQPAFQPSSKDSECSASGFPKVTVFLPSWLVRRKNVPIAAKETLWQPGVKHMTRVSSQLLWKQGAQGKSQGSSTHFVVSSRHCKDVGSDGPAHVPDNIIELVQQLWWPGVSRGIIACPDKHSAIL